MEELGTFARVGTLQRKLREELASIRATNGNEYGFYLPNGRRYQLDVQPRNVPANQHVAFDCWLTVEGQNGFTNIGKLTMFLEENWEARRFYNSLAHLLADLVLSHYRLEGNRDYGH